MNPTLEQKAMREVIFENLKGYIALVETSASPDKNKKGFTQGVCQFSLLERGLRRIFASTLASLVF